MCGNNASARATCTLAIGIGFNAARPAFVINSLRLDLLVLWNKGKNIFFSDLLCVFMKQNMLKKKHVCY